MLLPLLQNNLLGPSVPLVTVEAFVVDEKTVAIRDTNAATVAIVEVDTATVAIKSVDTGEC